MTDDDGEWQTATSSKKKKTPRQQQQHHGNKNISSKYQQASQKMNGSARKKNSSFGSRGWCSSTNWDNNGRETKNKRENMSSLVPLENKSSNVADSLSKMSLGPQSIINNNDFQTRRQLSLTNLLAEYGEHDPNWDDPTNNTTPTLETATTSTEKINRLVPRGKGPIHIQFFSFGYKYGLPPAAGQQQSPSSPLAPFDCRSCMVTVTHGLSRFNGTHPLVKRFFKKPPSDNNNGGTNATLSTMAGTLSSNVITAVCDAVGKGYGYASPLEMTVYIGSELGRHRSVVLVETTAVYVRNCLRKGDEDVGVNVSVGTGHRDIYRKEEKFRDDDD
mmetsp:Transcript_19894/g.24557  ORF Transcript_19894/g.24557 Transcript_19894/m.24557 type:complete len:331 (-) Transcript_19894:323-1315(-)|eukprot:CAMPEP_0172502806 /NCGR_PEP_ID=MMETSP1066-20121228/162883_1 /TAXON_ID=671091 /ORGANISM="Coscinodiscus wailesii, Strain CCMP2513" /LENGTH=330 /DNA_ID=CAMNT_0013278193 /DNA_START=70 /DNA_END=1065 /DNA_ORIENTATION=+